MKSISKKGVPDSRKTARASIERHGNPSVFNIPASNEHWNNNAFAETKRKEREQKAAHDARKSNI